MKVVIQDQTEALDPALRRYTESRLGRLSRHFDRVLEAEVHFAPESKRGGGTDEAAVKILIHPDGRKKPILKAEARGRDLQVALDLALDKVDRQVLKLKDKIVNRHHGKYAESEPEAPVATVTDEPERVITGVKAESVSQAMDALEANGHLFHLFLDEDTGDLLLIYRRGDGSVAIIEPRIT
jgi:putative sigma-54 modulation protein